MITILLILSLNLNSCDSVARYKDTIKVSDRGVAIQLIELWNKHPLPNVKTPVIIYKPEEND